MSTESVWTDQGQVRPVPRAVARMFDRIAPRYDFLNHLISANQDRRWRKRLATLVLADQPERVLDFCCGTADVVQTLKDMNPSLEVIGTDFSSPMLKVAQKKLSTIPFVQADVQNLPFNTQPFDAATVAFGIRNVSDPLAGLKATADLLRPGGKIWVLEISHPRSKWLNKIFRFYFEKVMPFFGNLVSASPDSAYRYLPQSVLQFPQGEAFIEVMKQAGLEPCHYEPLSFGMVSIYGGQKL